MHRHVVTALALASTAFVSLAAATSDASVAVSSQGLMDLRFNRHLPVGSPPGRLRRSRGAQAQPQRRRNGVTHSRRVRRKHRRAA